MEGFTPKTQEELRAQLKEASEEVEGQLVPESQKRITKMSLEEIKQKFPLRFEMYLKILRSQRQGEEVDPEELSEMKTWLIALNNLDDYIEEHKSNEEGRTLRERQFTAFEAVREFVEHGGKEGYIKMPTGVGKTVIFSELIEALGLKTLIVVPTQILVEQTEERLSEFAENLEIGKIYQYAKEHKNINITTYQSLVAKIQNGEIDPEEYKCLILDEAHKALSEKRTDAIKKFDKALKLGFTATPTYSEDKNVKGLLNYEIYSLDIKEAVREGVISGFKVILVQSNIDLSSVIVESTGEYNQEDLEKTINREARNKAGVDVYKKMFNGEFAVVYCSGIKHAEAMARLFNGQGISAVFVSGKQNKNDQEKSINDFKSGKAKVICNADILIEGFDEEKASVCINLRPTLSKVVTEQRGGRVLRLDPENKGKIAKIVDFVDIYEGHRSTVSFADIVGESAVFPASQKKERLDQEKDVGLENTSTSKEDIGVEFKIIISANEVLEVLSELGSVEKEKKEFLPFDQLQEEVRVAGIKTQEQYGEEYKKHLGWLSHPWISYKDQWPGWKEFAGTEFLSFDQLRKEVRDVGIMGFDHYHKEYKNHLGWPSAPNEFYKDQWPGMEKFLGTEFLSLPFNQLQKEVRDAKIETSSQYKKEYKNHSGWPSDPSVFYKDQWPGWEEFLGKEKKEFIPFDQLKKEVRDAKINGAVHYSNEYKNHSGWPSQPRSTYKNQWVGWEEFLGKEKKEFIPFDQFKKEVIENNIKNKDVYLKEYKKHPGWPSEPSGFYKDQWPGWPKFLGKE